MAAWVAEGFRKTALFKRVYSVWVALLLGAVGMSLSGLSQPHPITATVDASKTGAPISKNIYGQFLEHGGDIVNNGVWAEMLQLKINGTKVASAGKLWRMAPDKIDATVQVDKAPEVQVEEQPLGPLPDVVTVRPFSVSIYSYPVQ